MSKLINMTDKYETQDGTPVRVLCVDSGDEKFPVVVVVAGQVISMTPSGKVFPSGNASRNDLRKVDPYKELKAAHAAGKVIQCRKRDGVWLDISYPNWDSPANCYRIKPEPKTVKLLAFVSERGSFQHAVDGSQTFKDLVGASHQWSRVPLLDMQYEVEA